MHFLVPVSLLIGAGLASPLGDDHGELLSLPRRQAGASAITITWEKNIISGELATSAWDSTSMVLLSYSCTSSLKVGDQDYSFQTDDQGAGIIQVGGKEHVIQPDGGEGVACSRRFNNDFALTECEVPVPPGLVTNTSVDTDDILECFSNSGNVDRFKFLPLGAAIAPSADHKPAGVNTTDSDVTLPARLGRRQRCSELVYNSEIDHPNRDPRKWGRHAQVTPVHDCQAADTCGIAYSKAGTLTYEASIIAGGPWFGGGFAVSRSETQGWEAQCGGHSGQKVCIWTWAKYQEYNIRYQIKNICGVILDTQDGRVRSPITGGDNFGTYCVVNTCRGNGEWYWIDEGAGTW